MRTTFPILALLLVFTMCHPKANQTKQSGENQDACLKKAIDVFSKTECDKNPNVKEYTFQDKPVFVFDPGQCGADMTSEVLDKNCKSLGFLGGFTGNFKINGEDFSHAVFVKTVWEK